MVHMKKTEEYPFFVTLVTLVTLCNACNARPSHLGGVELLQLLQKFIAVAPRNYRLGSAQLPQRLRAKPRFCFFDIFTCQNALFSKILLTFAPSFEGKRHFLN